MDHVKLNLGNVIFIGAVSATTIIAGLAVMNYLSKRDVPLLSPTARGTADFIGKATAA